MLGTLDNAEVAAYLADTCAREETSLLMPGWDYLGRGVTRAAWLGPDNVVYKVGHYGESISNEREYQRMMELATRPLEGWSLPKVEKFVVDGVTVLATEFLGDDRPDVPYAHVAKAERHYGLTDLHCGNLRIGDDGLTYIIDAGE